MKRRIEKAVVLGAGMPLFSSVTARIPLELIGVEAFPAGAVDYTQHCSYLFCQ